MTMPGPMPPGAYPPGAPGVRPGSAPAPQQLKVPTRRSTRTYLLVALVLAVFAFVAVLSLQSQVGGTYVLKADQTVPARTKLTPTMFSVVPASPDDVVDGAYKGSRAAMEKFSLTGFYSRIPIAKGSQLTRDMAGSTADLTKELKENERLASFQARLARSVGGTVRVGDTVDIYGVADFSTSGNSETVSWLLAENVRIVAVAPPESQLDSAAQRQSSAAQDGTAKSRNTYLPGDPLPGTYTVVVDAALIPRLLTVEESGELFLAYRAPDATNVAIPPQSIQSTVCAEAPGAVPTPLPEWLARNCAQLG